VRKGLAAAALLALTAAVAAVASHALRQESRLARPTDTVRQPPPRTEWWYVHAIDPATARTVIVTFFTAPVPAIGGYLYTETQMTNWSAGTTQRPHAGRGVRLAEGGVHYDDARRVWIADEKLNGYEIHLKLWRARPGVSIGPFRFGQEDGNWAVPAATSRADGWIVTPAARRIVVRNWRGYLEHAWGSWDLETTSYRGWEWAAIHEAPGTAWLLGGINRLDGTFIGVLTRVTPKRTTRCIPSLRRERWKVVDGLRLPQTVSATCGGRTVTFHVVRPYVSPLTRYALSESVGRTDTKGSIGFIEHFAPLKIRPT
jgi:hypothetical protein